MQTRIPTADLLLDPKTNATELFHRGIFSLRDVAQILSLDTVSAVQNFLIGAGYTEESSAHFVEFAKENFL